MTLTIFDFSMPGKKRSPRYKRLTDVQIEALRLVAGPEGRMTPTAAAKHYKIHESTVRYWLNTPAARPSGERQRAVKACAPVRSRRAILDRLAQKIVTIKGRAMPRFPTAPDMRDELEKRYGIDVCTRTVQLDLKKLGYKLKRRHSITIKGPEDIARRYRWVSRLRRKGFNPRHYIFTDEKKFTIHDFTYARQYVKKGQRPCGRETSSDYSYCYVWVAIGKDFKHLRVAKVVENGEHVRAKRNDEAAAKSYTATRYVSHCLSTIVPHMVEKNLILQQDGHRSHTAKSTKKYLDRKGVRYINDWPARSPDLNPAENVWAYLAPRVSRHVPRSAAELKVAIEVEFAKMPLSVVNNTCDSFQTKVNKVFKDKGQQ